MNDITTRKQIKIAFGYKSRSGKDTAAEYLKSKHGGDIVKIAQPVYELAAITQKFFNKQVSKDPKLLQTYGQFFRDHYGENIWIDKLLDSLPPAKNQDTSPPPPIYCTDLRYKNECAALRQAGFFLVWIVRNNRPIDRDPNHISETELDSYNYFDFVIDNNGSLDDFYKNLDQLFFQINKIVKNTTSL